MSDTIQAPGSDAGLNVIASSHPLLFLKIPLDLILSILTIQTRRYIDR